MSSGPGVPSHQSRFFWEIYFFLYLILMWEKAYNFFSPSAPQHLYFKIMRSFHPAFLLDYGLTLLQILFHIIHVLPLALYTWGVRWGTPRLWHILFILRLAFEATGHPFEMNTLAAFYRSEPKLGLYTLVFAAAPFLPSYWACWRYAFRREKISIE